MSGETFQPLRHHRLPDFVLDSEEHEPIIESQFPTISHEPKFIEINMGVAVVEQGPKLGFRDWHPPCCERWALVDKPKQAHGIGAVVVENYELVAIGERNVKTIHSRDMSTEANGEIIS